MTTIFTPDDEPDGEKQRSKRGSAGGKARRDALSKEDRKDIARRAAESRWAKQRGVPTASHVGDLKIGETVLSAAVLEDGSRLLASRGIMAALGRPWKGQYSGTLMPPFLTAQNLIPFIDNDLKAVLERVEYLTPKGGLQSGYRAELLPMTCEVYLKARDQGDVLTADQLRIAYACEVVMRALAHVGIMALVDEATGYQEVRDRMALAKILDKYLIREGYRKWEKMFQIDYYREMFRLKGWAFDESSNARPAVIGRYTTNVVYQRIKPGILKKLEELNPKDPETGRRKRRHHQYFTGDIGVPELKDHLSNVIFLMKTCQNWDEFLRRLDRAAPRYGDTIPLDLGD